jgi:deoxycytidine triphosphate deaminase
VAFTQAQYDALLADPENAFLTKGEQEKYDVFKQMDPFPDIKDSLLNSVDILKYIMTVGMITPFDITKLEGVTYDCHFSGEYHYWDEKDEEQHETLNEKKYLTLKPNSITYLKIKEKFRIPDYIIFRYNLNVAHVYKGLLLGTGPIVDPGFVGHIFIPLHNLTNNEYIIKAEAKLITIEFTKVGRNEGAWPVVKKESDPNFIFDFSSISHAITEITPEREFHDYINKALVENPLFKKSSYTPIVSSSIPKAIIEAKTSAEKAEESARKAQWWTHKFNLVAIIATIAALVAVFIDVLGITNDISTRIDPVIQNNNAIVSENQRLHTENKNLKERIHGLETVVEDLQKQFEEGDNRGSERSAAP